MGAASKSRILIRLSQVLEAGIEVVLEAVLFVIFSDAAKAGPWVGYITRGLFVVALRLRYSLNLKLYYEGVDAQREPVVLGSCLLNLACPRDRLRTHQLLLGFLVLVENAGYDFVTGSLAFRLLPHRLFALPALPLLGLARALQFLNLCASLCRRKHISLFLTVLLLLINLIQY